MTIRELVPGDAAAYTELRREMLQDSPWAFAASPGDDRGLDAAHMARSLAGPGFAVVGAFGADGALVGAAGVHLPSHAKMAHRAHVWGVYVTPALRGRQVGRRLLARVKEVAAAWPGVTSLGLSASERSTEAIRLYQRTGFTAWGREPGAVMIDGVAYDEIHMVAFLGRRSG